ncbi:MAG: proline hydroxylase [Deltaproteobacteria bacterium]|nr:MAG: proline hydroxylase [Deltaproteobacteria bacterium]
MAQSNLSPQVAARPSTSIEGRIAALNWNRIQSDLAERGYATTGRLLTAAECSRLVADYESEARFRSRVVMAQHGFGRGEYKYFRYPLPEIIAHLRPALYEHLAPIANRWEKLLGGSDRYPSSHSDFLDRCRDAGQSRPTPLLLRYEKDDYNCLHQDVYGEVFFPLQVTFLLSTAGRDFTGGEFLLAEQRPRMQSRAEVVPFGRGEGVVFAGRHRPAQGTRGAYRVTLRHGVSRVRSGRRFTLGVIFHDAT